MHQPTAYFDSTHDQARQTTRRVVADKVLPYIEEWEEAGEFPRDLYRETARAGLLGVGFPEALRRRYLPQDRSERGADALDLRWGHGGAGVPGYRLATGRQVGLGGVTGRGGPEVLGGVASW